MSDTKPAAVDSLAVAEEVDALCDRYEAALRRGEAGRLDAWLPPSGPARAAAVVELARMELEYRLRAGGSVRAKDYIARFPELAADPTAAERLRIAERQAGPVEATTVGVGESVPEETQPQAPAPTAPLIHVPGCEILGELGRGGMGVVYQARQTALKRLVAVKVIRSAAQAGPDELQRFRVEVEAVARLQHPNIVQIYELGEQAGSPYCVLEFVDGGSLAQKLAGNPLAAEEAARLAEALARAVAYAHQRQILHRDLKPANVLLTADGEPKITDYGLAKRLDDDSGQTRTGQVMGTPSYMAPEQATGDLATIGPRTDIYALGAILYEMLTGAPPFAGPSVAATLLQVQTQDPTPPTRRNPRTPRDLETICLKCLQKDPARRYGSALQLAQDVERFRGGEAILARPEGVVRKLGRKLRRRWPLLASGLALVAALIVAWFVFAGVRDARRLAALENEVRVGLDAAPAEWTAAHVAEEEGLIAQLEALTPDQARRFREELHQKFRSALDQRIRQPRLEADELAPIQEALNAYAGRWPDEAGELQTLFQRRQGGWQEICAVSAPFAQWQSVFAGVDAAPDAAGLVGHGTGGPARVMTTVQCQGDEEGEVRWEESWTSAPYLGLILNGDGGEGGYRFLLSGESDLMREANQASRPAPMQHPGGRRYMQIWRNGQCLREQAVDAPAGSLSLRAGRRGGRLEFQLNDLKPLLFEDPFPLPAVQGRLGLWWPLDVRLTSFHGRRRTKAAAPSPLERGDDLYAGGHFAEAMAAYEEAAATAGADVGLEARYKAAVCLIERNRLDEAADRLESVAGAEGERWPLLATNRLWLLRVQQGQIDKAEDVFQSLAAHAGAEDAALYLPHDFGATFDPLGPLYRSKSGLKYLRARPEDCERIARTAHSLEVLKFPPTSIDLEYQLLVRYRWMVGQTDEALNESAYWLGRCQKDEPMQRLYGTASTLLNRVWLLGTLGNDKARQGVGEIDEWIAPLRALADKDLPDYYVECLLQRARLHCVLEEWGAAEDDAATGLRILQEPTRAFAPGYHVWSDAYLLDGFLLERRGEAAAAREAWRKGSVQAYRASQHTDPGRLFGMTATTNLVLVAAAGDLDDATAQQIMDDLLNSGAEGTAAQFQFTRLANITPADLRRAMQSPRGHDLARRFAFGQVSFPDWTRGPVLLMMLEKIRAGAFAGELSAEQDEIVWRLGADLPPLYASGGLSETQLLQLGYAWSGAFGATGPLGWGAVAPKLPPEVRGPLAYVLGNRLLHKQMPSDAESLFRTALADAPADSPLHRLAQAELDRLKAK